MKKILFTFVVDNTIDIITNSSSELFVLEAQSEEHVKEMIREVYPNYLSEYEEVVSISTCSNGELGTYVDNEFGDWDDKMRISNHFNILPEIMYENYHEHMNKYWYPRISDEGYRLIREKLPKNLYFLYSSDENPNWDFQEKLSDIAQRYHLG